LWRHGGVVFCPHPRDFSYSVPQKLRCVALRSVLSAKVKEKNLVVLEAFVLSAAKTKEAARVFANLKITSSALLLIDKANDAMQRAVRNLENVDWNIANNTNTYEVLSHKKLVLTKDAVDDLVKRLKK
jgi:large subunit ribosomal protein L4